MIKHLFCNKKNIILSLITTILFEKIENLIFFSFKKKSSHNLAEEYYQ